MWNAECKMIVFSSKMIKIIGGADTIHSAFCIMNSALQRVCAAKLNDNLLFSALEVAGLDHRRFGILDLPRNRFFFLFHFLPPL